MCGCKNKSLMATRFKKRKIGKAGGNIFDGWNFEELAIMGAGGLAAKAVVNPLSKAVLSDGKYPKLARWFPLVVKGGLAVGLNMINDPMAKLAAKGAVVAMLMEAGDTFAPAVFKPQAIRGIYGWDDDVISAVEIDLSDINGYDDEYDDASVNALESVL